MIPEKNDLVIPYNVHLIIPYCCGLTNTPGNNEPEDESDTFIQSQIESDKTSFDLTIDGKPKTHLIGRPNTRFCDNKLEISIDPHIGLGIFKKSELSKYRDEMIFHRHQVAFEECNKSVFDKNIPQSDLMTIRNIFKNSSLAPQPVQSSNTDYSMFLGNYMKSLLYSQGDPVIWTINNVFNQVILPIVNKVLQENENPDIIFKTIIDQINKIQSQFTWEFFQKYAVKKKILLDTVFYTRIHFLTSLKESMMFTIFNSYHYYMKSPVEKQFYQEFFKDWDGLSYKQLYLSDIVSYLSKQTSKDIIIINNSCQGFSKKTEVCHASRCIHLHRNVAKNKPIDEQKYRYNVKDETKWCSALQFLELNGSNDTKEFFKKKTSTIDIPNEFFPDCIKSYLPLFANYIDAYAPEIKSSLDRILYYKEVSETVVKPYVYAIFNTFIERAYRDLSDEQKILLDNIML